MRRWWDWGSGAVRQPTAFLFVHNSHLFTYSLIFLATWPFNHLLISLASTILCSYHTLVYVVNFFTPSSAICH